MKLHPLTVLQRARAGEITAAKPGKCWVFIEEDLVDWIRSHYNRYLNKFLSGVKMNSITRDLVEKVITDKPRHATPGRVNRITALIRAVLRKSEQEWDWIDKTPSIR